MFSIEIEWMKSEITRKTNTLLCLENIKPFFSIALKQTKPALSCTFHSRLGVPEIYTSEIVYVQNFSRVAHTLKYYKEYTWPVT